jgi:hypothetical protein
MSSFESVGRNTWRNTAFLLCSLLCLIAAQPGFAQTPSRFVLSGTVLNSATGSGIARALVSYSGPASGYRFTDASGSFHIENAPAGWYGLTISKPGFLSENELSASAIGIAQIGASEDIDPLTEQNARRSNQTIAVELKEDYQPAKIKLVPVASMSGIVLDENSEPLEGVVVQGIAVKESLAGPDYVPARTARTDDRGRYALLNLPPGDYVVRLAGEVSSTNYFIGNTLNPNNDHRGMQPVYYPNVDSLSSALVLHLPPAEKVSADFRQATVPAFDINGRLSGFVPHAWTQMQLYRDGDRVPVGGAFVNLSSGQFRMVDVARGNYLLRAVQYQADPPEWLAAETPVIVTAEPVRNLVIELSRAVDIPVSVSYEAGAKAGGQVYLTLQPQHTRDNVRTLVIGKLNLQIPPNADAPQEHAQFDVAPALTNVIPDKYRLNVTRIGGIGDYVASAKLGDIDVLHSEFPVGGVPGELHVTIRGDSANVQGQVTFEGRPALGAEVYLIPATGRRADLKVAFADDEGHYMIAGVTPGDYRIRAWAGSPSVKELLSGAGETLALQPNEHRAVTLEATPGSDPSPQRERPRL